MSGMFDDPTAKKAMGPLLGFVFALIVILVISGLSLANAISADLASAVSIGVGFIGLAMLVAVTKI